jgi:ribosomal subunit interface protein
MEQARGKIMQVSIQSSSFTLTDALRNHVQTRLGFTFSRARNRVRLVQVRLSDLNGPRGGIDKRCLVKVCMEGLTDVVVEDVQPDMYHAIDRAADRAARTVMRRLALDSNRRRRHARQQLQHLSDGL